MKSVFQYSYLKRKKKIWVELSRNTNYADRAGNPNESEYDFAIHMSIMARP